MATQRALLCELAGLMPGRRVKRTSELECDERAVAAQQLAERASDVAVQLVVLQAAQAGGASRGEG